MKSRAASIALLAAALIVPAPAGARADAWPERYTNPKPLPDDLVLPLPCGGSMAFHPVPVPA